ncbi:MAG: hypothetical protein IIB31_04565 [Chloroflexi bacterium]|nr:hypothetical protein [Chloroflexota bacterium]
MAQDPIQEQILEELTRRAQALWGPGRAAELKVPLQDTARNMWEIRREPPENSVEPGFYQ